MTDPQRLKDAVGTTDLQRSLLGALAEEAPRAQARERTLAALGLPVAVGGAAAAGAASKAAASVTGATSATSSAKGAVGLLTWVQWGGALVALSMIGGSAYVLATGSASTPRASSAPVAPRPVQSPATRTESSAAVAPSADTVPTLTPEALPRADDVKQPTTTPTTHAAAPPSPSVASPTGTLMEELSLMDGARRSFAQGSYGDAVRAVSAYEARYPEGSFVQEADFLRVRALYEQHDPGAPAAARAFLTRYPSSPYAPRVRTLVGSGP